jgi:hypothetical protein
VQPALSCAVLKQAIVQAVPVVLLLADGAGAAAALRHLVCWCVAWAALLAAGSAACAAQQGTHTRQWLSSTYGFMLVRQARTRAA